MKPIYQLYEEWQVIRQKCTICGHEATGMIVNQKKEVKDSSGLTIEEHIRKEHPKEIAN